ncbi:MAG: diacylglycerol kinase family protein [Pseudomonadota bacterium]
MASAEGGPGNETVALVANPHSRKARRDPKYLEKLERAFGERGLFVSSPAAGALSQVMADVFRARPSVLFISGGDGTLRQCLTHLIAAYGDEPLPKIAILRGGTMNTVATSLGIRGDAITQLKAILDRRDRRVPATIVRRRMLSVNRHNGFIFGLGGFARFIEHYDAQNPTPFVAFKLLTRTVLSTIAKGPLASFFFQPFTAHVWRDGKPWLPETTVTNISASSIRHIGFHFKPFYGAEEDGSFGVLVFRELPRRLILHLPRLFLGHAVADPSFLQVPAKSLLIKVGTPMRPMLDGDILKADTSFEISNGPELELVVA